MNASDKDFNAWASGKPLIVIWLATGAVSILDEAYWWLKHLKSDQGVPRFGKIPSPEEWLTFYEDEALILDFIGQALSLEVYGTDKISLIKESLEALDTLSEQERREAIDSHSEEELQAMVDEARRFANWMLESSREAIRELERPENNDPLTFNQRRMLESPPMQFLLRVWVPCLILYHESPASLYRRAQANETSSLEKLLRLDKAVLQDPTICDHVHQSFQSPKRPRFKRIGTAMAGRPIAKLSKGKIRSGMAGLISHFAQSLGHRTTEPQIRGIFDIAARAKGAVSDRYLPESPETLSKAIQRERPTWKL